MIRSIAIGLWSGRSSSGSRSGACRSIRSATRSRTWIRSGSRPARRCGRRSTCCAPWRQLVMVQPLAPQTTLSHPARRHAGRLLLREHLPGAARRGGASLSAATSAIGFRSAPGSGSCSSSASSTSVGAARDAARWCCCSSDLPDRAHRDRGPEHLARRDDPDARAGRLPPIVRRRRRARGVRQRRRSRSANASSARSSRASRRPRVHRVLRALLGFAGNFVDGVASLREPRRLAAIVVFTAVLFVVMVALTWALARAFHFEEWIGFGEAMGVLCITMLGIALPAPPGFAGVFEAAVRAALAVFGVGGEALAARALAFALVFHWGPYLLLAHLGRVLPLARQDRPRPAVPLRARGATRRAPECASSGVAGTRLAMLRRCVRRWSPIALAAAVARRRRGTAALLRLRVESAPGDCRARSTAARSLRARHLDGVDPHALRCAPS